ncbi:MAG: chromosomal replication initiator protein DnaA [Staphylococcus sp.]|nr:chromosomal replication initiator protein DnaA [Staphylococcus sp.]
MEQAYVLLNNVKNELKEKLLPAQYNTIFNEITEIYKVQGGNIYLIVANSLEKFRLEKIYLSQMNEILNNYTKELMQFKFITSSDVAKEKEKKNSIKAIKERVLRPEYTFDNFVTGEANREAFTFSVKVAESPHVTVNPFYIFGDVGLGKTHLMMAIGHYILDNNLNTKIVYTTAQQFVEDYFKSKNKNQKSTAISDYFDNYYRSADVLLVDDIQYLADRQGSQDEFFKLFEYLFEKNKQIIVTSDRKASELNIMDRLKSRFTWGMQVDIKKPNQNLRKAILKSKLSTLIANVDDVSNDALDYIATNFEENVRELEGALRRFVNYCVAFNIDYTLENAKLSLESIISSNKISSNEGSSNQAEKVKTIVASYFNIPVKELSGSSRKQEIVYARSIAIYLLRTKYNIGLKKIGEYLGNRDHATVAHAIDKIEDGIKSDEFISQDVSNLVDKLNK